MVKWLYTKKNHQIYNKLFKSLLTLFFYAIETLWSLQLEIVRPVSLPDLLFSL